MVRARRLRTRGRDSPRDTGKPISSSIQTTHLKENYRRRNGVPSGPKRTMTEQWIRHGNILTIVSIVEDPEFLTEPLVLSQNWVLDPGQQMATDGCEYVPEFLPNVARCRTTCPAPILS